MGMDSLSHNTRTAFKSKVMSFQEFGMTSHEENHRNNMIADLLAEAKHLISPTWLEEV